MEIKKIISITHTKFTKSWDRNYLSKQKWTKHSFFQYSHFSIQHFYSGKFSIGQGTSERPLGMVWNLPFNAVHVFKSYIL